MAIDFSKPVQTRSGKPARILCTDKKHPYLPVVGLVYNRETGNETCFYCTVDGYCSVNGKENPHDLINVPEPADEPTKKTIRYIALIPQTLKAYQNVLEYAHEGNGVFRLTGPDFEEWVYLKPGQSICFTEDED